MLSNINISMSHYSEQSVATSPRSEFKLWHMHTMILGGVKPTVILTCVIQMVQVVVVSPLLGRPTLGLIV